MKKNIALLVGAGVFLSLPLLAQNSPQRDDQAAGQQTRSQAPEPPEQERQRRRPAASFTPSEKIRADTVVAFPADI